jgi:PAS domain S-box-containing protein
MSSAHSHGDASATSASAAARAAGAGSASTSINPGNDPVVLLARVSELEGEVARLRAAEQISRQREQQLSTHNLVLVNLSRSSAIEEGDVSAAFEQITVAAAHTLEVERASIWVFSDDRSEIRCLDLYERSRDRHSEGLGLKAAEFPSYFRAVEDNRTLAAEQARTDPRTAEFGAAYLTPLGITSMLDAPVRRGGKLIGVICHEHIGPPRAWSLEDQAFAGSLADFVSMTLQAAERADALRVLRSNERQLRHIIDLVPHMILAKDGHGRILLANRAVAEAYGTTADALIGRSHWAVHPLREEVAKMLSDDLLVIESGRELVVAEETFTDARGNRRILQTTKMPFVFSTSPEPAVLGVSIDITQRKHDEQAREMMIEELDHRVKNNLAVVMALVQQSSCAAQSLEAFSESFCGRLGAMAITHEVLAGARWEGADLRAMAERIVAPYQTAGTERNHREPVSAIDRDGDHADATKGRDSRVNIEGEALRLPSTIAPSVCMILHELATNAAKYGALSSAKGRVALSWHRELRAGAGGGENDTRSPWLHIEWIERGGPHLAGAPAPERCGFGTTFIRETAQHQLHGRADLDFATNGLQCTIKLPLEQQHTAMHQ